MWPAKGFSAWPHCEKVFWELKVKRSVHAKKPFTGHSLFLSAMLSPYIFIYFSIVLNGGSPCLLRISLVNFITAIFVSGFNVKFSSFFEFEGVLELDRLDDLYWSKETHTSPPLFSYFSGTSSLKSSEIHKQISFNKIDPKIKVDIQLTYFQKYAKEVQTDLGYSRKFK